MAPWAFISPASRGLGLAIARRVLQTTDVKVVATARKDVDQVCDTILSGLYTDRSRLTVLPLDVIDESTISSAAKYCGDAFPQSRDHLHLSFVLPGILHPEKAPSQIDASKALATFQVNAIGPLLLMKHFSAFLPTKRTPPLAEAASRGLSKHATWANMSARVGSITDNNIGGWYSYRASKAAVNQITKTFDNHLHTVAGNNAMAIAIHPGTVRTGLSEEFWTNVKKDKLFEADWVAERLVGLIGGHGLRHKDGLDTGELQPLDLSARGKCWDWAGKEVPP